MRFIDNILENGIQQFITFNLKIKSMRTTVMKDEIFQYLSKADERFLNIVYGMVQADREEKVSKDLFSKYDSLDLIKRTLASEEDIQYKRTTKIADFKIEVENWKSKKRIK
jgi:hypothetical protein